MVQIMKTDGGPHPARYWAQTTVNELVQLGPDAGADGQQLRDDLVNALDNFYSALQSDEAVALRVDDEHLLSDIRPDADLIDAGLTVVNGVVSTSNFADHFADPKVQDYVGRVLAQHVVTCRDVDRSWHADLNPTSPASRQYRAARNAHGPLGVHSKAERHVSARSS